jgi:hypothetical protein
MFLLWQMPPQPDNIKSMVPPKQKAYTIRWG